MEEAKQLLSKFLEELKAYKNGVFLDRSLHIFYNDWSKNPDDEDDYSERQFIHRGLLKDIDSKNEKFSDYEVLWWDIDQWTWRFIDVCVRKKK